MTHHTSALSSILAAFSPSRRHAASYGKSSVEARCVKHFHRLGRGSVSNKLECRGWRDIGFSRASVSSDESFQVADRNDMKSVAARGVCDSMFARLIIN